METDIKGQSSIAKNIVIFDDAFRNTYYEDREVFGALRRFNATIITSFDGIVRRLKSRVKIFTPRYLKLLPANLTSYNFVFVRSIQNIIRSYEPSVIITYELYSTSSYQISRIRKHFRFTHAVICYDTISMNEALWGFFPPTRFFALKVRSSADLFIALNNRIKAALVRSGVQEKKIHTVYPGIFIEDYSTHLIERPSDIVGFKLLFIGALRRNKGLKTLLSAFILLRHEGHNNLELIIAGRGPIEQEVKKVCDENGGIHFEGYVSEDRKRQLLLGSDVFVYPSEDEFAFIKIKRWEEQTATSLCEAMAAGLPAIVSDSGSLPEIIGNKEAVFHQGCIECLKDKILEFYKSRELRTKLALYNLERSKTLFNIRVYSDHLEKALLDAISDAGM